MKRILFCLLILLLLCSCSDQNNMNDEMFFERYGKNFTPLIIENSVAEENMNYYFIDNGYLLEMEHNNKGDIIKISVSGKSSEQQESFVEFLKSVIDIYSSDDEFDVLKFYGNTSGYFSEETQWYSYSSAIEGDYLFFSVNNKRLNPEKPPELTLKQNKKTH